MEVQPAATRHDPPLPQLLHFTEDLSEEEGPGVKEEYAVQLA